MPACRHSLRVAKNKKVNGKQKEQGKPRSLMPVPPEGLEPPTYCSASKRSNPLSYEGVSERIFYPTRLRWSRCVCYEKLGFIDRVLLFIRWQAPGR